MARRKEALLRLHQRLVTRRDALRRALAGDLSLLKELRETSGDLADAALDLAHNEVSSQLAELESRELNSIERALDRMRQGTYGTCEHCGAKIPMARLNALPYTSTCITCQRDQENMGEGGSGSGEDWQRVYDAEQMSGDQDYDLSDIEADLSER